MMFFIGLFLGALVMLTIMSVFIIGDIDSEVPTDIEDRKDERDNFRNQQQCFN